MIKDEDFDDGIHAIDNKIRIQFPNSIYRARTNTMVDVETAANTASFIVWHGTLLFFVLSVVGNLLNFYILTRRNLRSNPCSLYFLASTACSCIIVWIIYPLRFLQVCYNIDVTLYGSCLCSMVNYVNNTTR